MLQRNQRWSLLPEPWRETLEVIKLPQRAVLPHRARPPPTPPPQPRRTPLAVVDKKTQPLLLTLPLQQIPPHKRPLTQQIPLQTPPPKQPPLTPTQPQPFFPPTRHPRTAPPPLHPQPQEVRQYYQLRHTDTWLGELITESWRRELRPCLCRGSEILSLRK